MEEQKAMGGEIPGEFITSIKTSLMGPLAGVGDTIWQGVVIPILIAICIDITLSGTIMGSVIYAVAIIVLAYGLSSVILCLVINLEVKLLWTFWKKEH